MIDALSAGCLPPVPGLVGWWAADGDMKDRLGKSPGVGGNNNGISYAAGEVGLAFDLGGLRYVSVDHTATLTLSTSVTVEGWIFPTSPGGTIASKMAALASAGFALSMVSSNLRFAVGGASAASSVPLTPSTWTHVAGVSDGKNVAVYVNGQQVGTAPAAVSASAGTTEPLHIGADRDGAGLFAGNIDELALYDRALSPDEIGAIMQAGTQGRCKP